MAVYGIKPLCGMLFILGMMLLTARPVRAAEREKGQESWQNGAGVAALIDHLEEEEVPEEAPGESTDAKEPDEDVREPEEGTKEAADKTPKGEVEEASTGKSEETADEEQLVMANVSNVLNVRREPDTEAELAGYLYADCGGTILERRDGWTLLVSGELTGWAKDDYLLFGEEAEEAAEANGRTVATTITGALRIRKEPSLDAGVYDLLEEGAEYEVVNADQLAFSDGMEITEDWVAVDYAGKTGFVSADYVKVEHLVDHGETVEQVQERQQEEKRQAEEAERAQQQKEAEKAKALATQDDLLLAALIQCEAGSDVYEGKVAVGAVVMNRVKSAAYPNTIKDVIFASGQFTPAGSGKLGRLISSGKISESCIQAAQEAMAGVSPVGTATHFRRAGSREGIIVGAHVFW